MNFAAQITETPLAFDAGNATSAREGWVGPVAELIAGAAGSSPYLQGLLSRERDWIETALNDPDAACAAELERISGLEGDAVKPGLRIAKRRVALVLALCDLGGVWPLEGITRRLSEFADAALGVALRASLLPELRRGKIPGLSEADVSDLGGMVALAMGKMGAFELNYSSDIDLICLFDESRFTPDLYAEARSGFVRATRKAMALLSEPTGEGYVFRTDLRLRPDPSVTPVCIAMETAERYYESLGRTWERAAHIKARPAAGDLDAGAKYLKRLTPFVWRKHLDFAAIQDAHDMRLKIRAHKGLHGPIDLLGHDLKLGQGGIRDIEFFTQTRQIIAGGRDPDLRLRGTQDALAALANKGWVAKDDATALTEHYRALRTLEHRVQMVNDAQTHSLPKTEDGLRRIANLCGTDDLEAWAGVWRARLEDVARRTEPFFQPRSASLTEGTAIPVREAIDGAEAATERWRGYPALRSGRAVEIFDRLRPDILNRLAKAARPEEALQNFDGFLAGLPAGVQLFSLFEANPQLVDLIVDICATAPRLSRYLSRNASVLDAVIGGPFFNPWPGRGALVAELSDALRDAQDYEAKLDTARRWQKEWHFRIGVHHLRRLIDAEEAAQEYTELAEAVLQVIWPLCANELSHRHGPPPGRGAVLVGMGSLGAATLTAQSDLDLIVIYDAGGVDASDGPKPLMPGPYYAKLTKALVTALSAAMSEGRLYEIDMRLRPSGRQGPVATGWTSFQSYQRDEAWTWEHLALTRARIVAASCPQADTLAAEFEGFRRSLLQDKGPGHGPDIAEAVRDMRERLAAAKPAKVAWEAKRGPGRLQDIELFAQMAGLMAACPDHDTRAQLKAAKRCDLLDQAGVDAMITQYALLRRVQMAGRLLTDDDIDPDNVGTGGRDFVVRQTEAQTPENLTARIREGATRTAEIIAHGLAACAAQKTGRS
ncbi:bifunctional [glutamine synthetase] adenylyltransferase/[glutamine synthetase]-adenylyl-L-tyrosine phosphorylase [Tropicimonas sp. S265A]|uniref:bifunctional [glutamine synthetase] adenylyltransferase/[glutamine synthetase]-adenylyl-L-tyrosine phosphorylase n=1 Tax=Tropicimonas sp. S265A TaxID=3415134 RepID=UPI003C7EB37C